eukprot:1159547-Pelagomonas_calceolata.AAC.19
MPGTSTSWHGRGPELLPRQQGMQQAASRSACWLPSSKGNGAPKRRRMQHAKHLSIGHSA